MLQSVRPVVASLDLGVTTGFCVGAVGGKPTFGAWRLADVGAAPGARFGGLSNMIADLIGQWQPALVLKEAPLRMSAASSELVRRSQFGLHAACEEACWRLDVHPVEVGADSIRKHVLGRSRWPKGTDPKKMVLRWCQDHGFAVLQPDAADAIVAWIYACDHAGDLMRQAARL